MPTDQERQPSGAGARASSWITVALALILAGALALRLIGIGFLLPHLPEPDGIKFFGQLEAFQGGDLHGEPTVNLGSYPSLVARLTALLSARAGVAPAPGDLAGHLRRASAPYVALRTTVALLSWLIVPATWLFARRFLAREAALAATALMGASVLHLWFAQQARPHAVSAACALLSVLASLRLRRTGRPLDWMLAGLALGLSIGSLQSGVAALFPFLAAVILRTSEARETRIAWGLVALALAAACVRFLYPFAFDPAYTPAGEPEDIGLNGELFNLSGHSVVLGVFNGRGFAKVFAALWNYEPWILGLAGLGGAIFLARIATRKARIEGEMRGDLLVALAYAAPYLVAIGLYERTYQRFSIPLLPYMTVLAGYGIAFIAQSISARLASVAGHRLATAAVAAVVVTLVGPQVFAACRLAAIRCAPDTGMRTADWIRAHLKPGADRIFVMPAVELPLPETPDAIEANRELLDDPNRPWYRYQRSLPPYALPVPQYRLLAMPVGAGDAERIAIRRDPVKYLAALQADYAVIEVYEGRRWPVLGRLRTGLVEIGERLMRASPDAQDEGCNVPLYYQDDEYPESSPWLWRVLHARSFGPILEVYELKK